MHLLAKSCVAALVLGLVPAGVHAATLTTYTQYTLGSTCSGSTVASGEATSSCGSFTGGDGIDARASFGSIGIRSQASGPDGGFAISGPQDYDYWRGGAAFSDTLNFSVDSGTLRLSTDIAATLIENVTGSFGGSSFPAGRNHFEIAIGSTTIFKRYHEYQNTSSGSAGLVYTDDFGSTGTGFFDIAFTGGTLNLNVNMYIESTCGAQHTGSITNKTGTCLLGADAYNSLRLIGATVLDANGDEITGATINADSGFDYMTGVEPHVSAVPVPASVLFLLSAVGGLALVRRRVL